MSAPSRPLTGQRIVVTRAREQAAALRVRLEALGAEVLEAPAIRLVEPPSWDPLDRAIEAIEEYDWVLFTSQNALPRLADRLAEHGLGLEALGGARICAIGEATAQGLRERGMRVDIVPRDFRAEGVVEALAGEALEGQRVLLPRALVAREVLPRELERRGARVDVVPVYQAVPDGEGAVRVREALDAGRVDAITFTSSSTVTYFLEALSAEEDDAVLPLLRRVSLASIGPITSQTLRDAGLEPAVEAAPYTIDALVEAIAAHFAEARQEAE